MKVAFILTGLIALVAAQKGTKGSGGKGLGGSGGAIPKAGEFSILSPLF
jgi:hypothetical protein